MQIDFSFDPSTSSAPAGFATALAFAAGVLDALIANPITVNINVGWNEIGGAALGSGTVAEGGPLAGTGMSYAALVAALTANASNPAARQELASLPATAPSRIASYYIAPAQEKAWGLLPATASQADGEVGFSSAFNYSFDPNNQSAAGLFEFIGIAEHEITHALGRIDGDGPLELVNYAAPGVFATPNTGGYFSIDGGSTNLGEFDATPNGDTADWAPPSNGDSFEYLAEPGLNGVLTPVDQTLMGVLGFNVNQAPSQFLVVNTSSGPAGIVNGTPYTGPVPGLSQELILVGSANLNVTAYVPNSFIHTGSGEDAINVSATGGNNVLDGSTGSNFLTGGPGGDTFYVDDRDAASAIWSTIAGFHAGDTATIWGITRAGFTIDWLDNQGAPGSTGLTGVFTAPGQPAAAMTLAGYTSADLSNGRLSIGFGASPDEPGLPGSVFMSITAT
jgi:hypothetical protein